MAESQIRQTAYKVWIADLVNGEYITPSGEWEPSYIKIKDKKVSRVNIIANVISKYQNEDSTYISLTIDDGSENIQIKAWNEDAILLKEVNIGDMILTVSRVRQYNNNIYLVPEIVKKLDKPEWITLRKLELISEYGERTQHEKPIVETPQTIQEDQPELIEEEVVEDVASQSKRQKLLNLIKKNDNGDGVEINLVVEEAGFEEQTTTSLIQDLLKEGEIFEIKPGRVKLIE